MLRLWLTLLLSATLMSAAAQMWNGTDTLYGNEWIEYSQSYYRIDVGEEGLYRIPYAALQAAGLPVAEVSGSQYQLWRMGEEVPLYSSTDAPLQEGEFLEFYGQPNEGELDAYLYGNPETRVNPWYSLVNDTMAYYLTWVEAGAPTQRYSSVPNTLSDLPPAEAWHWSESRVVHTDVLAKQEERFVYNQGNSVLAIPSSTYKSDGFTDGYKKEQSFDLPCPGLFPAGPPAQAEVRFISNAAKAEHELEVYWGNTPVLQDTTFLGSHFFKLEREWAAGELSDGLSVQIRGLNGNNDRYAAGGARVRYPRDFAMGGAARANIDLPAGSGPRYLELAGMEGATPAIVYDLSRQERLEAVLEDGVHRVRLKAQTGARQVVVATQWREAAPLQPVDWADPAAQAAPEFLILTHAALRSDPQGNDWVQAYADYRSSSAGGSYQVSIWGIAELYDQFGYGVERHPIAIRNFIHFLEQSGSLEYVMLIGKGREYHEVRDGAGLATALAQNYLLLPAFGYPASDNLLAAYPGQRVPTVPIGRVAAVSPDEVRIYLEKVQAFEANRDNPQTLEGRAWMKRVLHLGGGSSATEQSSIRNGLRDMERLAEGNRFGAQVATFFKDSAEPLEVSLTEQIFSAINAGSSLLTFFGHSSPGTFDFNIDNPDNYNNTGKTPLMLSLGCYSGNIFTDGRGISERFVFLEDQAAVAFGASRGLGFISTLTSLGRSFYHHMGSGYYGRGIGAILQAALQDHAGNAFIGMQTLVEQFSLHGDPALRLHPAPGPDYTFDPASVAFEPRVVSAQLDSFALRFDVVNLGQHLSDTLVLEMVHELPDGSRRPSLLDTITLPRSRTTFTYRLPVTGPAMVGENRFLLTLDPGNAIAEAPAAAEQNNELLQPSGTPGARLFVVDNTARPVWPPRFAVVGADTVTLSASTTNALAPERTYRFELDTTPRFDSPLKQSAAIRQRGGVVQWRPAGPWQDSTAYFWRITPDSTETGLGAIWAESTFTWIGGSSGGWMQGGTWQWEEGTFDGLRLEDGGWRFVDDLIDIRIRNKIYDQVDRPGLSYDNDNFAGSVRPWSFLEEGLAVVVSHPFTASFWRNPPGPNTFEAGDYGVPTNNSRVFAFPTATFEQRANLLTFLEEVVPEEYFVFCFTILDDEAADLHLEEWEADTLQSGPGGDLFSYFEAQGALRMREMKSTGALPYIFMYQKGGAAMAEILASGITEEVNATVSIPRRTVNGTYYSKPLGPAKGWEQLTLRQEIPPGDSLQQAETFLLGVTLQGDTTALLPVPSPGIYDLTGVNADSFPYLQLRYYEADEAEASPIGLTSWRLSGQSLPEVAIDPHTDFYFHTDTLERGETLSFRSAVRQLNFINPSDSLEASYIIQNPQAQYLDQVSLPLNTASGLDTLSFTYPTRELGGGAYEFLVRLDASGDGAGDLVDINNYASIPFWVAEDRQAPLTASVLVDGRRIIDQDIVPPNPQIAIQVVDDNEFLLLDDTSLVDIYLTWPDQSRERISFDRDDMQYTLAASGEDNEFRAVFQPYLSQDSVYLLEVYARDASSNPAGRLAYKVRFKVVHENRISHLLNYPNPFSTSTRFVYELTGVPPQQYKVQIMTISGRVVRELTELDLGPLRIGRHQTEGSWDGTDTFGDPLANGVYLYRILFPEEEFKDFKRTNMLGRRAPNSGATFFKNNWSKLVILR